jgi:hypothetical protein
MTNVKGIIWIIPILIVLGISIFLCVQNFIDYFAYEVVSTYKVIPAAAIPFPAIKFTPAFGIEEMTPTYCSFQDDDCSNELISDSLGFSYYFNNNLSNIKNFSRNTGIQNDGLFVIFDVKFNITNPGAYLTIFVNIFSPNGRLDSEDGVTTSADINRLANILISKTEIKSLSKPFSDCIQSLSDYDLDNEIKTALLKETINSQDFCVFKCKELDPACENDTEATECNFGTLDKCLKLCPNECSRVSYSLETSYRTLKESFFQSSDVNTREIIISIAYSTRSYISIVESRKITNTSLLISIAAILGFLSTGYKYSKLIVDSVFNIFK